MSNRLSEPPLALAPTDGGDLQLGSTPDVAAIDESELDQPIDRPVRERTVERPDPAEITRRGEQFHDRPAMGSAFADDCQTHLIGERKGDRRHASTIVAIGRLVRN